MTREEVFAKLKVKIVEGLGVEEEKIQIDSTFIEDLSADSLDIVELIMSIEEEFEMSIPDDQAEKIVAVSDVVDYILENQK